MSVEIDLSPKALLAAAADAKEYNEYVPCARLLEAIAARDSARAEAAPALHELALAYLEAIQEHQKGKTLAESQQWEPLQSWGAAGFPIWQTPTVSPGTESAEDWKGSLDGSPREPSTESAQAQDGPPWLADAAEALGFPGDALNWTQVLAEIRKLREIALEDDDPLSPSERAAAEAMVAYLRGVKPTYTQVRREIDELLATWDRASREPPPVHPLTQAFRKAHPDHTEPAEPAAPAKVFYCCGNQCPGLPWKASDQRHPSSCAGPGTKPHDPLYDDPERTENPNPPSEAAPAQGGTIRERAEAGLDSFTLSGIETKSVEAWQVSRLLYRLIAVLDAEREREP